MSGNDEKPKLPSWVKDGKIVKCSRCGSTYLWRSVCKTSAFCMEEDCGFISFSNEELITNQQEEFGERFERWVDMI